MQDNLLSNPSFISKNSKIHYWVTLWEEMLDNYNDESFGINLKNPHFLILNILDEIESNQFKNKENKKYFIEQLGFFLANDPAVKINYNSEFKQIISKLQTNEYFYLKHLCHSIKKIFHNGEYFDLLYTKLLSIIKKDEWETGDSTLIKYINQSLITELLIKGYELNDIVSLPRNLFDNYEEVKNGIITDFPVNVKIKNFLKEDIFDLDSYKTEIIQEMKSLSIDKRLSYFVSYFTETSTIYNIIHQIKGIKAENFNQELGPVRLYSPQSYQIIKKPKELSDYKKVTSSNLFNNNNSELFYSKIEHKVLNAVVTVTAININSAIKLSKTILNRVLDLINLLYKPESKLSILPHSIILNSEMEEISSHLVPYKQKIDLSDWHKFLELKNSSNLLTAYNSINKFIEKPKDQLIEIEKKVLQALYWYRKACDANEKEDQLLNYWIIIENFISNNSELRECCKVSKRDISKFDIIKEIIPNLELLNYNYSVGWEIYNYLFSKFITNCFSTVPVDLVKKCQFGADSGSKIYLLEFLNNFSTLKNFINQKLIIEKIEFAENFFFSNKFAYDHLIKRKSLIKTDLLLIYRLRNRIVHNAVYDETMLTIYVQKVKNYAEIAILSILKEHCLSGEKSIDEILIKKNIELTKTLVDLELNTKSIFDLLSTLVK